MRVLKFFICGSLLGVANTIPGVSGGTLAVIMGIYEDILNAFSFKNLKKNLEVLVPILIGALITIYFLSSFFVDLLNKYPRICNFAFIGLIIGSLPSIGKKHGKSFFNISSIVLFLVSMAFMIIINNLNNGYFNFLSGNFSDFGNSTLFIWLIVACAISAFFMVLPGVSGALMLLLFGVYKIVLSSISEININNLVAITIGVAIGLSSGILIIRKMIKTHPKGMYSVIIGLLVGSIPVLYPGFVANNEGFISLIAMVIFGVVGFITAKR